MSLSLRYKTHATPSYRFTTTDLECEELKELKDAIKKQNANTRCISRHYGRCMGELYRVRIMPRGHRVTPSLKRGWGRRGYDSYLPIEHGEYFDIYVHTDGCAYYNLRREFETGLKPGELKKIEKLKNEIWKLELKGLQRKRS